MSKRSVFIKILQSIASNNGFEFATLDNDWLILIRNPVTGRSCNIVGYTFETNSAAAAYIANDKCLTYNVLQLRGIQAVPHLLFFNPLVENNALCLPKGGNWHAMQEIARQYDNQLVVKPAKGTGGYGVVKVTSSLQLEKEVQRIFAKEDTIVISPLKKIIAEYRVFVLHGEARFVYRKDRECVIGDGVCTVQALIAKLAVGVTDTKKFVYLVKSAADISSEVLNSIPTEGEEVPLQWRHNLGLGAHACFLELEETKDIVDLAIQSASAIGIAFASVDIVDVEGEGFAVLEINSGVMMDSILTSHPEKFDALKKVYEDALLRTIKGKP